MTEIIYIAESDITRSEDRALLIGDQMERVLALALKVSSKVSIIRHNSKVEFRGRYYEVYWIESPLDLNESGVYLTLLDRGSAI